MRARIFINKVHFFLALIAMVPVVILCLTGSVLVFKETIDEYFTSGYMEVETREVKLSIAEMKARLEAAVPGKEFVGVVLPPREGRAYFFWMKDAPHWTVGYIDPYTGDFKGLRAWEDWTLANTIWWVTDLHSTFKWGEPGSYVVAASSAILLFSMITGLILWWPRTGKLDRSKFTLRVGKRWKQSAYNLHAVLGFYASAVVIVLTLTGMAMTFAEPFSRFLRAATQSEEPSHPPKLMADVDRPFLPAERLIAIALGHLSQTYGISPHPESMGFPTADNVIVEIGLQGKPEYAGADHTHVFVNAQSGEVVAVETAANRTGADTFVSWIGAVHYGTWGEVFGESGDWLTRILWFLSALTPLFLFVSGYTIVKKSRWKGLFKR